MKTSTKFSVIIPAYNREKIVADAIESVLNQGYENLELIIVDDGSSDGTSEVLQSYERADSRVKAFTKANGGVSSARNKGLDEATGEYIIFLDSDDRLCHGIFSSIDEYVLQYGKLDVFAYGYRNNVNSTVFFPKGFPFNVALDLNDCRNEMSLTILGLADSEKVLPVYCTGKAYKRSVFDKNNIRFDEKLLVWEDGVFSLNVLKKAESFLFMDKAFYELRDVAEHRLSRMYYLDTVKNFAYRYKLFEDIFGEDIDFTLQDGYNVQFKKLSVQIIRVIEKNEDPDFSVVKSVLSDPYIVNIHKKAKASNRIEARIKNKVCSSSLDGIEGLYKTLSKWYVRREFFSKVAFKLKRILKID